MLPVSARMRGAAGRRGERGRDAAAGDNEGMPGHDHNPEIDPFGSEHRLRSLFDRNPEAIFSLDAAGRFNALNPVSETITGYTRAELIGNTFLSLIPPEELAECERLFARALTGETVEVELSIFHKQGWRVYVQATAIPITIGEEVVGVCGIARDITAQKKAEAALRASEQRFRQVLEAMQLFGMIVDRSCQVIFCNDCICEALGRRRDEILGKDVCTLIFSPERRSELRQDLMRDLARGHVPPRAEHEVLLRDGKRCLISWQYVLLQDSAGEVIGLTCIGEDITERRREETRLLRALNRERRIAEALQETLLLTAPPDVLRGLKVAPLYVPALDEARIGGDFYDTIPLPAGRIALVVGDAAGKGLAAATRTAEAKFVLRAYLRDSPDPGRALSHLNSFVAQAEALESRRPDTFITVSLVVIEPETGIVIYATAGADPPLFLRNDGSAEHGKTTGLPLGVVGFENYQAEVTHLMPGEVIVMATDGIVEARRDREFFGHDRMEAAAVNGYRNGLSLHEMGEEILNGAREFARGSLHDDVCLLIAQAEDAGGAEKP